MRSADAVPALALALAATALAARAEEPAPPIPWQDPAPLARPFLQLPFEAPAPIRPGQLEVGLRALYGSAILRVYSPSLYVDLSVESAQSTFALRYGVRPGVELQLSVPGLVDYAGFLGKPIKWAESLFANVNPLRVGPPPRDAHIRILRPGGAGLDWAGSTRVSAGDIWAGVKARIQDQRGWVPALAWRGAVKIPTADPPFGSGQPEIGGGLLLGWTFDDTSLYANADLMIPRGRFTAAGLQTRPHASAQVGVGQRVAPWLSVVVQGSAHASALSGTGFDSIDGATWYLLAGIVAEPTRESSLGFAVVENVLHPSRGEDATAVLTFAWRW